MRRIASHLGIDRAVFFTLITRGWNIGAGFLSLVFIANFLTPSLQGYYYTFNSLIALQVFAELGLNFAIVQFASHEMAHLSWSADGVVIGEAGAKRRLQSLLYFAFSWFGVAALLMVVVLLPAGFYFFDTGKSAVLPESSIMMPWGLLVVFAAANLFVSAASAILEGCGKVAHVAMLRLWQSMAAVPMGWLVLSIKWGLFALTLTSMMTFIIGFVWLYINYRHFFKDMLSHSTPLPGMHWRDEIWPFQWRIAVSWASGYLIFQFFNPFLFKTHGAIVAGQMGMTLQIITAMNGAAITWISTKAPVYGQLIATNQRAALDVLFRRGLLQSLGILIVGVVTLWLAVFYLNITGSPYAVRVVPLNLFTWLCVVCLANHIVFSEAAYLRAHKQEPFLGITVMGAVSTVILVVLFVPQWGVAGAVYSYVASALLFGLVGGSVVFFRKRKQFNELNCSLSARITTA